MKSLYVTVLLSIGVVWGMTLVSSVDGFTNAQYCLPNGDYLYLLDGYNLYVLDVSDPSSPTFVDTLHTSGYTLRMAIFDTYGFLGCGNQLMVLDLSDPAHPAELGSVSFGPSDYVYGVAYHQGYVYAAATNVFKIFQFTPPSTLTEVYSYTYGAKTVACWDHYCAIGLTSGGILVFDISDPSSPLPVGGTSTPGYAVDIDFDHGRVYLADGAEVGVGTGHVLLFVAPDFATEAGRFSSTDGDCRHGCSYNTQYLVANGNYGFQLLDWTDPASPTVADEYTFSTPGTYATDANIAYPYIYAVTRNSLLILTSDALIDTAGGSEGGPTVTLVEPANGVASSCLTQPLVFLVQDPDGVNWSSLRMNINGTELTSDDLYIHGDTVRYAPMIEYPDGDTVYYSFEYIEDTDGNPSEDLPLDGYFIIDYSPPVVITSYPGDGDTVPPGELTVSFEIIDSFSGIDSSSVNFSIDRMRIDHSDLEWTPNEMGYSINYALTVSEGEVHTFCVNNLEDNADYCGANSVSIFCWTFFVETTSPTDTVPPVVVNVEPENATFSSNPDQSITFSVSNDLDTTSFTLTVNGENYSHDAPEISIVPGATMDIVFTPADNFSDGDTVIATLSEYYDIAGNAGTPVSTEFYIDLSAPEIEDVYPADGDTVTSPTTAIQVTIHETGAGVDTASLRFVINAEEITPTVSPIPTGAIATYVPTDSLPAGEITVRVTGLEDTPDYGEPNLAPDYEWSFYVVPSAVSEGKLPQKPRITTAPNPFNSACRITAYGVASPQIEIYDARGNLVATGTGQNFIWRPGENLPTGKYLVKIHGENFVGQATVEYVK